jgi:hypothetical protein
MTAHAEFIDKNCMASAGWRTNPDEVRTLLLADFGARARPSGALVE